MPRLVLVWDERNEAHVARHGVSCREVEEVLEGRHKPGTAYGGRRSIIGPTRSSRMLTVFLHQVGGRGFYVVTARDASRRERLEYFQQE